MLSRIPQRLCERLYENFPSHCRALPTGGLHDFL